MKREHIEKDKVQAKKQLGQHFLTDKGIAKKIGSLVSSEVDCVIEIGPGMGVMTQSLYKTWGQKLACIEIDAESVEYLSRQEWAQGLQVIKGDFLILKDDQWPAGNKVGVVGNFPYNISTQIVFRMLESDRNVTHFAGMFQKEVAKRFCAPEGNKEYGVTSVLLQAYYDCSYEFTVNEGSFNPPPKVKSGVISCYKKSEMPSCSYKNLKTVVKLAFGQRRKTLSNALKSLTSSNAQFVIPSAWVGKRAEQLTVNEFIELTKIFENSIN